MHDTNDTHNWVQKSHDGEVIATTQEKITESLKLAQMDVKNSPERESLCAVLDEPNRRGFHFQTCTALNLHGI